jgi:hypothetical protein
MIEPDEEAAIARTLARIANTDRFEQVNGVITVLCAIAGLEKAIGITSQDRLTAMEWRVLQMGDYSDEVEAA